MVAGTLLGGTVLLCGGGAALLAAGAGAWWYAYQPTALDFPVQTWTLNDAAPTPVPAPRLIRRYGEPVAPTEPVVWTVQPPELGAIFAGSFTPAGRGSGSIRACVDDLCGDLPLQVELADTLTVSPAKAEIRVWKPRTLSVAASWSGEAVTVPLRFSSTKESVATVDQAGVVTPVGPGTTEIQVRGGGAANSVEVHVYPRPPEECTLSRYADVLGRKGTRTEQQDCLREAPDMCEWTSSQALVDGGRLDEGGGWEWGWTTLWLPSSDVEQVWEIARLCLDLPPELAALPVPELMSARPGGQRTVPLSGSWDADPAEAVVSFKPGTVMMELPSVCSASRTIAREGAWLKLMVSEGC